MAAILLACPKMPQQQRAGHGSAGAKRPKTDPAIGYCRSRHDLPPSMLHYPLLQAIG
jgi:hypothetical protein